MKYYIEYDATKAGHRPVDENEFTKLVAEGFIFSDKITAHARRRLIVLDDRWFCWNLNTEGQHTCWEFDEDIRFDRESFQKAKNFFIEIGKL